MLQVTNYSTLETEWDIMSSWDLWVRTKMLRIKVLAPNDIRSKRRLNEDPDRGCRIHCGMRLLLFHWQLMSSFSCLMLGILGREMLPCVDRSSQSPAQTSLKQRLMSNSQQPLQQASLKQRSRVRKSMKTLGFHLISKERWDNINDTTTEKINWHQPTNW